MQSRREEPTRPEPEAPPEIRRRRRRHRSSFQRAAGRFKLFRIFRKDRPFAFMFGIAAVLALAVALAVPRIWSTAPPNFARDTAKVSLIDLAQVWSLSQSARQYASAGEYDVALFTWQSAIANNLADAGSRRGLLQFLRDAPRARPADVAIALQTASWLLALTGTNATDAVLVADVLEKHSQAHAAWSVLQLLRPPHAPETEKALARCALSLGRFEDFDLLWRKNQAAWSADPRQKLYRDAWEAASGGSAGLESALRLREALASTGPDGLLAARLLHQAAVQRGWADDAVRSLDRLKTSQSASIEQHALTWRVLAAAGRKEEAQDGAVKMDAVPLTASSAAALVDALRDIGLRDRARDFLDHHIQVYGTAIEVWRPYFDLLAEMEKWSDVRRRCAETRTLASPSEPLWTEILLAEYRDAQAQSRETDIQAAIKSILPRLELPVTEPETVLRLVRQWRADRRPEQAIAALKRAEERLSAWPAFWIEYFQVGFALRDVALLRRAVTELTRLEPNNPIVAGNRAALLLITGEEPAEALRLTLVGVQLQPQSIPAQINHAIALQRNGRGPEAAQVLEHLPADRLGPDIAANYYLALAEVRAGQGRRDEATAAAARIDRGVLLPPQIERLENLIPAPR